MEHPRAEANRLAMHQPAGMRAKGLQGLPSLKEEELYSAILKAIRSLVQGHQEEMAATLQEALAHCIGGENAAINPLVIENRLHDLDKDLDRLLTMEGSEIVGSADQTNQR